MPKEIQSDIITTPILNKLQNKNFYKSTRKRIYINGDSSDIYFTEKEAYCMICFLHHYTVRMTANLLNLSDGTVFYYLAKMKHKMNCLSKKELVSAVTKSKFMTEAINQLFLSDN